MDSSNTSDQHLRLSVLAVNYSPETTGNAPYTSAIATALSNKGYNVSAFVSHPHYPSWKIAPGYGQWKRHERIAGVEVIRLLHYVPKHPKSWKRFFSEITFGLRLLTTSWKTPDVILMVSPALLSCFLAMLKVRRTPTVVWVQDLYGIGLAETKTSGKLIGSIMTWIERSVFRKATKIVVIHDRFRQYLVESLGISSSRISVIRNWTHIAHPDSANRLATRERLGWKPGETVVLHAGNQGKKQGLENVVAAARIAEDRNMPVKFVLMGDGNQRSSLESLASCIHKTLSFVDPLPEKDYEDALTAADVLLVNEVSGLEIAAVPSKLTSYFAAERPILAATSSKSVTAQEVERSGAGLIVPPNDPQALLKAVLDLRESPDLACNLAQHGPQYAESQLSASVATRAFDQILRSVTATGATRIHRSSNESN